MLQAGLAMLPGGEKINHQLQKIYRGERAFCVDESVKECAAMKEMLARNGCLDLRGLRMVELGTGWQPTVPLLLTCYCGAEKVVTFDHVRHVRCELVRGVFRQFSARQAFIRSCLGDWQGAVDGCRPDFRGSGCGLNSLLSSCAVDYRAPADAAASGLPAGSVDVFFSNKVLEHVPQKALPAICGEAFRVLKPGGYFYNFIGMIDHYAYFDRSLSWVNCLRYPDWAWKLLAQNRISYQNRLRHRDYLDLMKEGGFRILESKTLIRPQDVQALENMPLCPRFRGRDREDLAITFSWTLAQKPDGDQPR